MVDAKKLPAHPQHGAVQGQEFVFATDPGVQGATLWDSYFIAAITGILAGEHTRGRKVVDKSGQMSFPSMLADHAADVADAMSLTRAERFKESK